MRFIGLTGGVGAGKTTVLHALKQKYKIRVLIADEIAHELMKPGTECYQKLRQQFRNLDVWNADGSFHKEKLAKEIFSNSIRRGRLNAIVHPAVKQYIVKEAELERAKKEIDYLFVEAALLIEDHYDEICDELWYVYTSEENRRFRLKESRGYSDEKIDQIFASQLSEEEFRKHCAFVIDNNGTEADVLNQIEIRQGAKGEVSMENKMQWMGETLIFGLDIGTRNVVGTVGYRNEDEQFTVIAQCVREHATRAMLDGQIHDIGRVGKTIGVVKRHLEEQIGQTLTDVCIAAAGRVLKTVTTHVDYELPEEAVVTAEMIHTLELLGVDRAQEILKEKNDTKYRFYCVGYSVVKYYINDEVFSNLEGHKAEVMSADIIVTFLPEDVVDGLYTAVGHADLQVANLTLEPIAAINVAIPENFRMLNIALVDVGAGTSDICITRDGSIIAYGMIPNAGDEITELIVQKYLVDFAMAEQMKLSSSTDEEITFEDIMSISHTIPATEIWELTAPVVDRIAKDVATKIIELNGDKTVSATFVVGGGGKIHGFTERLAEELELPQERVALRGEEVLRQIRFLQDDIKKDPLIVTPVGICLNYYDQKNNFIMVRFNGDRIKLYDNSKLTIVDAALQAGFPNEMLFPRRGKAITFTVNGVQRMIRGTAGESSVVWLNGKEVSINTPLEPNCEIKIQPSTIGQDAKYTIEQLEEYTNSTIAFEVNHKMITCPRFVEVNGILEPPTYAIQDGDIIDARSYYTVSQLAEFMDVEIDPDGEILVNNRVEDMNALVYENFSVDWSVLSYRSMEQDIETPKEPGNEPDLELETEENETEAENEAASEKSNSSTTNQESTEEANASEENEEAKEEPAEPQDCVVFVNDDTICLQGKPEYVFIDVFDYIDFDLSASRGRAIVTKINGEDAAYTQVLKEGDQVEIRWVDRESY